MRLKLMHNFAEATLTPVLEELELLEDGGALVKKLAEFCARIAGRKIVRYHLMRVPQGAFLTGTRSENKGLLTMYLPLVSLEGNVLRVEREYTALQVGELWRVNTMKEHAHINGSESVCVHLVVEVVK